MSHRLLFLSLLWCTLSCNTKPTTSIFKKLDPAKTQVTFANTITETEEDNVLNYEYFYNGGGVAAADFNRDGQIDLFFTGNQVPNRLYLNRGQLRFEDVTAGAFPSEQDTHAWHTGVTVVDLNQDGWPDLYVSVSGNIDHPEWRKNKLFINNGDQSKGGAEISFSEQAAAYGLDLATYSTQAAFFDYDKDGDLDAYILNHNVKDFKRFDVKAIQFMRDSLAGDRLMQNDHGHFVDVSVQAGIKGNPIGFGLGIHIADLNNDTWPDIYVSNDYLEEDYLYINRQDGTFTDEIKSRTNHISYFSMGNDIGDLNNDLLPDIITTDMLPEDNKRQKLLFGPDKYEAYLSMLKGGIHPSFMRNMLQLNNGDGTYAEVGQLAGMSNTDWSWSVLMADFDNDGYKDLFFSNGYLRDYTNMDFMKYYADASIQSGVKVKDMIEKMPSTRTANYIYQNSQGSGRFGFTNKVKDWGFEEPIISNGAVAVDLDGDGDLELVTNNLNAVASIYQNLSAGQTIPPASAHYLEIQLQDSTIYMYGAKVLVYAGDLAQYQEYGPTHGYQSSNLGAMHFGLGTHTSADSIIVLWPDGTRQKLTGIQADQLLALSRQGSLPIAPGPPSDPLFVRIAFDYAHSQLPSNDFTQQRFLPQMCSYTGPRLTQADVDGDGLIDFYIGGGKGQAGQLFKQNRAGGFELLPQADFEQDRLCTDTDATFVDIDGDGDQDLYVASGGYQYLEHDLALQNRLYLNDGRGHFDKARDAMTDLPYADNVVKKIDLDHDGHPEILLGGGCMPLAYPLAHPTRLYRYAGGRLVRAAEPALDSLGVISDLTITDIDHDGDEDVLAVGEWSGILLLENKLGNLQPARNIYPGRTGLWNRIQITDIDNDGDQDLIVGNFGLNSQYQASEAAPITLSLADFDGNGSIDPLISYYTQGTSYPMYSKDELLDQLAILKKKYITYDQYASVTTEEVLGQFSTIKPLTMEVNTLETTLLINEKGLFHPAPLPIQAQYAPVYAMLTRDLNGDGYEDLILAGNQSHARVRLGRLDANYGQVYFNNRHGGYDYLDQRTSGLQVKGDVKDIQLIGDKLVIGINDARIEVYGLAGSSHLRLR